MKTRLEGILLLVASLSSGCSGINATKSVSPLDFILPGLMQYRPVEPAVPGETEFNCLLAGSPAVPAVALSSHSLPN